MLLVWPKIERLGRDSEAWNQSNSTQRALWRGDSVSYTLNLIMAVQNDEILRKYSAFDFEGLKTKKWHLPVIVGVAEPA